MRAPGTDNIIIKTIMRSKSPSAHQNTGGDLLRRILSEISVVGVVVDAAVAVFEVAVNWPPDEWN